MGELLKVGYEEAIPTISGRELHGSLEVKTAYKDWFPRMCEYGFTEGIDFNPLKIVRVEVEGSREVSREVTDHKMTIAMAKEIAMLQRTDKGKEIRQYLIKVEEAWNSPEKIMARALEISRRVIADLTPKAEFAEKLLGSSSSMLIDELAKLLTQNGCDTGEKRLYATLRADGYLCSYGERYNLPSQRAMESGWFKIIERPVNIGTSTIIKRTTRVTPKGCQFFLGKYGTARKGSKQ